MAVAYFKIGRTLMKQNKHIKSVCSNPVRRSAPSSSFNCDIFPKSKNFRCLFLHSSLLCSGKYSYNCVFHFVNRWKISLNINETCLDWTLCKHFEDCWFAFRKSSYIWNVGQKIVQVLEIFQYEETEITATSLCIDWTLNLCMAMLLPIWDETFFNNS